MADERTGKTPPAQIYKAVHPAGVAPEVSAGRTLGPEAAAAFGRWLAERLHDADPEVERVRRRQVTSLSGIDLVDLEHLLAGQPSFPLDADHVQRLAVALVEMRIVPDSAHVHEAAGLSSHSDYIIPPQQVVRAVSGND